MKRSRFKENKQLLRVMQHLVFIATSFFVLLQIFKTGAKAADVDYVYTALFLATILPVVYLHLYGLLPRLRRQVPLITYLAPLVLLAAFFIWINVKLFDKWSGNIFPHYFFISYYQWWEIAIFFLVFIGVSTLLKLSKSWFQVNQLQRQLLEAQQQRVQAELKALKSQINPHFFFNTLNNIYSMSLHRDERLPATILQLSDLMRYFLYESREDEVALSKELTMLRDYIALQKIRSDEKLSVSFDVEGQPEDWKIAPLLLITFVENAFKHGAKSAGGRTFVEIVLRCEKTSLQFRIVNNKGLVDPSVDTENSGLGLDNVKRRMELIYPGRYQLTITDKAEEFIVELNLHKEERDGKPR